MAHLNVLLCFCIAKAVVNFNSGTENIESRLVQSSRNHEDKVFDVHVINDGDPLLKTLTLWEIFSFAMLDLSKRNRWDGTY